MVGASPRGNGMERGGAALSGGQQRMDARENALISRAERAERAADRVRPCLPQCIHQMVSESRLTHKIVNSLF